MFVILTTFLLLTLFYNCLSPKYEIIAENTLDKEIKTIISDYKNYKNIDNNNLLKITKNTNDEIILMNYDMPKLYEIVDDIVNYIEKNISNKESGIWLSIPFGAFSKSLFLANLGPKIPIGIHFIGKTLPEVKTSVTNYGLNNALISIKLEIKISYKMITPVHEKEKEISYEVLLDTIITQGSVPNWYNNLNKDKVFIEISK